jgi:cytochrome c peroxidase
MKIKLSVFVVLLFIFATASTTFMVSDPVLPATALDYSLTLPTAFTTNAGGPLPTSINGVDNSPATNPMTNDGATLGRVLFYDTYLSSNGTVACASCHKAASGFSDPLVLSVGHHGGNTRRHSMTLINSRYYQRGHFFWDERAATLEEQVLKPFQDTVEMGLTLTQLVQKVNDKAYYAPLFTNAFGSSTVTTDGISKALSQFVRSIVSYSSKYDIGRAQVAGPGAPFPNFTAQENEGKQLFLQTIPNGGGACFGCHTTEAFVSANPGPQNNGIDLVSTTDLGAYETFPNQPLFLGRFKTPSLRNIELTAPYMHDGRFATLEQVVEHYNSGVQNHTTLSNALKDPSGNPIHLNFTATQKAALVAFLKTMTDNTIASAAKWSNPFPAVVLPIELLSFLATPQENAIALQWTIAKGQNNSHFYVEKSLNAKEWQVIGPKITQMATSKQQDFDYLDLNPQKGVQYYRLKQRDADGGVSYSRVASVYYEGAKKASILAFPNPASDQVTLTFNAFEGIETTNIQVYTALGKLVFTQQNISTNAPFCLDISSWASGSYFVAASTNAKSVVVKIVK